MDDVQFDIDEFMFVFVVVLLYVFFMADIVSIVPPIEHNIHVYTYLFHLFLIILFCTTIVR